MISYMMLKNCDEIIAKIKNLWYEWQLSCIIAYLLCAIAYDTVIWRIYDIFHIIMATAGIFKLELENSSWNLKFQGEWFWIWYQAESPHVYQSSIMIHIQVGTRRCQLWKSSSSSRVDLLRQAALTARLCQSLFVWVSISNQQVMHTVASNLN
jgi:hypothetical protein